jgi:hypothetical protein
LFAAALALGERVTAQSWMGWGLGVAGSVALTPLVAFALGLSPGARHTVLGRVRSIARSLRG